MLRNSNTTPKANFTPDHQHLVGPVQELTVQLTGVAISATELGNHDNLALAQGLLNRSREVSMKLSNCKFVAAPLVRRTLIVRGDVRADVAFQNDINALMFQIEEEPVPFRSVASLTSYSVDWLEKRAPERSFGESGQH